ncbi:MAG: penicillin-binding protein 2 [Deltaproteobacteria bacterium]|nr:penicillin-binding protein 2 [Deltaproteobacteria bacterium]
MFPFTFQKEVAPEFRRRTHLLMTVVSIVFLFLLGRLSFLQLLQGERFTYLSENNRIRLKKIPGIRGMIFDRNDQIVVDNRPSFDLLFVPEDAAEPEMTLRHLARFLGRDERELLDLLDKNKTRPPFEKIVLGRDVDWRSVAAVETHQLDLPGVTLGIHPRRSYLNNSMAAHLLGYLGEISSRQLRAQRKKGYHMGDEIGQFGMERSWEEFLRGRSGGQQVEVDAFGREVRVLHEVQNIPGQNVFLTLDRDLQETAYQALQGKEGAIVVLEVNSGSILALVSSPAFDPNFFARGITSEEWGALAQDRMRPLSNRATQGQYPPGSIFKIVLAIAGLEEGVIQPETRIFDPGYLYVGRRRFRGWKKGGHGWVDLHKAIVESCDVYFYQLGQKLGVDRIAQYARALGLGEKTGIALDDEKAGLIPDSAWKKKRFGQPWFPGETPSVAIGQSYVNVTPLQMANLTAAVANGGTLYRPWFVRKVESINGRLVREYGPKKIRSLSLKESTLKHVRNALRAVVNSKSGTGGKARSNLVNIAGKTGTAQVVEMRGGVVKSEQLPYSIRDHAWFVAYAPAENPEIAVATLVEHGGHGGSAAAPLAKMVIEKYFSLENHLSDKRQASREVEISAN